MTSLKARFSSRRYITLAPMLLVAAGAGALLFCFEPGRHGFYPRCLLHQTTGLLCPGCGSLRAMHQLLHGHILEALHLNALFVLAVPPACYWVARSRVRAMKRQPANLDIQPRWFWTVLIACTLFGILRNLPFAHALWLAP